MAPSAQHVTAQLQCLIYYQLDNHLLDNALFLAGRLHAHEPRGADSSHLLALCHLRLGQPKLAYDYSRNHATKGHHIGCAYVFAEACRLLDNRKEKEGISALERSRGLWGARNHWNKHNESTRRHLPDAAAVYCLLGKLWQSYGDLKKAVDCYVEALKLNPFMWDAFVGLCDAGAHIRTLNIFKLTPEMEAMFSASSDVDGFPNPFTIPEESPPATGPLQSQRNNGNPNMQPPSNDPFSVAPGRPNGEADPNFSGSGLFQKLNESTSGNIGLAPQMGGGGGISFEAMETPTGLGGSGGGGMALMAAGGVGDGDVAIAGAAEPPHAPVRKYRTLQGMGMDIGTEVPSRIRSTSSKSTLRGGSETDDAIEVSTSRRHISGSTAVGDRKRTLTGQPMQHSVSQVTDSSAAPQRRSVRLFNQIRPTSSKFSSTTSSIGLRDGRDLKKAKATGTKGKTGTTGSTVGRVVSGNRKPSQGADSDAKESLAGSNGIASGGVPKSAIIEASKQKEALQWLLEIFKKLGNGYFALTHFRCQDALQIYASVPTGQRETPWVLAQIGRAQYEQASYIEAEKYFRKIRSIAPSRLEDMEVYSTVLWHLKNEVELSYLAHELVDVNRLSPQAWCAIGNTFSLQRDHDQALKCFKRATQLQPKFAYAFTLQGHEHIANEEYDKALTAYRNGISVDTRHYNAWYGLGRVYEKMGKYEVAEKHFRTAAGINPTNAVLVACIGMVLEKLKVPQAALVQYAEACNLAPRSTLPRFNKARVLMTLHEPHLALSELKVLKDIAPDDANVHFLLGRVYKTLKQKANAIKHFTFSLNLDPKAGPYIKEAIESLEEDYEDDDGEMS
ncbi:MAG: anaphase-promoting complex subunit cdc27 [Piccolia ochrophora]|nr:MAG: anaphase-promoting complex subunit cdc27 [Piccolia ochrophora]